MSQVPGGSQFASNGGWSADNINWAKKPRYSRKHYGFRAVHRTPQSFQTYGQSWNTATPDQKAARMADGYIGYGRYRRGRRRRGRGMYTGSGWFLGIPTTKAQGRRFTRRFGQYGGNFIDAIANRDPSAAIRGLKGTLALGSGMYTGSGMYGGTGTTSNDLIVGNNMKTVPKMSTVQDETGALVINNSEYIGEVYGPPGSSFTVQKFALNPGIEATFPWLSQIAQNYEEYEMIQLVFEFRSTLTQEISDSNGQVGTILGGVHYNVANPSFKSKAEMLQYAHTASCRSTSNLNIGVECDPTKTAGNDQKYVRSGQIDPQKELEDYDIGRYEFAMHNLPSSLTNQSIGEMHVYYTVKLAKPKIKTGKSETVSTQILSTEHNGQATAQSDTGVGMNWLGHGAVPLSLVRDGLDVRVQNNVAIRANPFVQDGSQLAMAHENLYYSSSSDSSLVSAGLIDGDSENVPAKMSNVAMGCTTLTFPASFNGRIELQGVLHAPLQEATQGVRCPNFFWRGEVRPVSDMYGSKLYQGDDVKSSATILSHAADHANNNTGSAWSYTPVFGWAKCITTGYPGTATDLAAEGFDDEFDKRFLGAGGMFIAHFDIKQASRGTQNEITIQWPQYTLSDNMTANVGQLKILEYNSALNVKDETVSLLEKALDPASDKYRREYGRFLGDLSLASLDAQIGVSTRLLPSSGVPSPLPTNLVDTVEIIHCHPTFKDPNNAVVDPALNPIV